MAVHNTMPMHEDSDIPIGIGGISRDITGREQAMREREEHYRFLYHRTPAMLHSIDASGRLIAVSDRWLEVLGFSRSEVLGRKLVEFLTEDSRRYAEETTLPRFYETGVAHDVPYEFVKKNGEVLDVLLSAIIECDTRGRMIHSLAVLVDITERKRAEAALRESEELYRILFGSGNDAVLAHQLTAEGTPGNFIEVNDVACERLGYSRAELMGLSLRDIVSPQRRLMDPTIMPRLHAEKHVLFESELVAKDGSEVPVEINAHLFDLSGRPTVLSVARDLTERKEAEKGLRQREKRLQMIHETERAILQSKSPEAIVQAALHRLRELVPTLRASVVLFDPEANRAAVYATSPEGDSRLGPGVQVPLDHWNIPELEQGRIFVVEDTVLLAEQVPTVRQLLAEGVRSYISVPLLSHGELIGCLNLGSDTPGGFAPDHVDIVRELAHPLALTLQQARLLENARTSHDQLRELTRQLFSAQEQERQRVSRELHDEAGQALTALKISLEMIKSDFGDRPGALQQRITEAVSLTEETMEQIRLLARGLRPPELDALGLNLALEGFCRDFSARTQLAVDYDGVDLPTLREGVAISLYRILQEALTNVAKHADARRVRVGLLSEDDTVCLSVQDDGHGFDVHAVELSSGRQRGNGIVGMRERLKLIGGALELDPKVGEGTRLVARVPLKEAK